MHYTNKQKASFCTVSESKRQDAAAIWTHMEPVLRDIRSKFPTIDTIHFWSDGPSKQYKNKTNFYLLCIVPTSHGKGAPDGIGGTVKRTADSLILRGHDIINGDVFQDMVGSNLCKTELYTISEADMQPYDTLLAQPIKPVPGTRKFHQVAPTYLNNSEIICRSLSCFCSDPQFCSCFSPTIFQLHIKPHRIQAGKDGMTQKKGPLALLMEEVEQEETEQEQIEQQEHESEQEPITKRGPIGTVTNLTEEVLQSGDWLADVYDQHWWLARAVTVDSDHQDVKVEFFHPHGPTTQFFPCRGGKDMCFVPFNNVLVKLEEPSTPVRTSRRREIYHLPAEVMDFIEEQRMFMGELLIVQLGDVSGEQHIEICVIAGLCRHWYACFYLLCMHLKVVRAF
ncbi:uncharacterized protein LOC134464949 [Engraulis encrasicolus]|uniref:uncharacterized protein LOC134464949 n=1 Tax=Engraulis encrasicolus TaxID=184585 RepID=UPI002FD56B25